MSKEMDAKVARLKERIGSDPAIMVRVLRVIYDRQQAREKYHRRHLKSDGKGFSVDDTPFLCELFEKLEDVGFKWQHLSAFDVARGQARVRQYARQYLVFEKERKERELEESRAFWQKSRERVRAEGQKMARETWGDAAVVE